MSQNTQPLMLVPLGSIEAYIRAVNEYPMLTAEEERELAERLYYDGDVDAAKQLVLPHLRFVAHVARGYSGYGLPQADLIQEGNIGLMKAVKRFNPEVGVRLVSFAVHWIKAEIHEYVLRNWRVVKVATTKSQRKLFFNLRKSKKRFGWFSDKEVNMVAKELGVSPSDVTEMESRLTNHDLAFEHSSNDDNEESYSPAYYLEDKKSNFADNIESENYDEQVEHKLSHAMLQLDERSQHIIQARWLDDEEKRTTLQTLATEFGISVERVRQLESNALKKLRNLVTL